jgi:AmmeMemoRadiSam system protein B/AmmeMemoRadiSam system protein A
LFIVPHAGYIYSGPVAAYGCRLIKEISPKRIILLGPSHQYPLEAPVLYGEGSFLTPLGEVPINSKITKEIKKRCPAIELSQEAHMREHSLEVQLPFLQRVLSGFEIVPILVPPHRSLKEEEPLAKVLSELLKEDKDLIVLVSTDMSHYHPYREAMRIDADTAELIKKISIEKLGDGIASGKNELCGDGAVLTGMLIAQYSGADSAEVLSFLNSGDTQGDKTRVVGYISAAFYKKKEENADAISDEAKAEILKIARETITSYIKERKVPQFTPESKIFKEKRGVFVTLMKHGDLRGCIGRFEPDEDFLAVLQKMAVESSTQDYRFPPVTEDELKDIEIEVSILSPLKKIGSLDEFIAGKHGIYMRKGMRSSTFLPQVALEQGWDKEETLRHLCLKAGLDPYAWKKDAEFYIYTSTIINEVSK